MVRQPLAGWQLWEPPHHMTQLGPGPGCYTEPFGAGVSSSLHIKAMILDSAAGRDSKTGAVILNFPPLHQFPFHCPDLEGIPVMEQSTPCLSPLPSRVACYSRAWLGPPSMFLSPAAEAEDKLYLPPFENRGWAEDRAIVHHATSRAASWGHMLLYIDIIPSSHMTASKTKYDNTNCPPCPNPHMIKIAFVHLSKGDHPASHKGCNPFQVHIPVDVGTPSSSSPDTFFPEFCDLT